MFFWKGVFVMLLFMCVFVDSCLLVAYWDGCFCIFANKKHIKRIFTSYGEEKLSR